MDLLLWISAFLVALVLVAAAARLASRVVVFEYERGLRFSRGHFKGVLSPGVYWYSPSVSKIIKVDTRPARTAVAGQEVLSADGVAIKASITATYQIKDPERAVLGTESYQTAIHTELQLALRSIVSSLPVEDLLSRRGDLPAQLKGIAADPLRAIGVELQDAAVRDLTFPGELKKIFTQVVKARQEGLAALEKARGETAALRNLANAAQMIERSPQLMQLRLLQVLAQQPGNTLVLGVQQGGTPIPLRERSGADLPPTDEPSTPSHK
jgi:regulator of protease activity HflC (stomatin/prohibitin superfamily)